MEKEDFNAIIENAKGDFDIHTPTAGHKARFLKKLNDISIEKKQPTKGVKSLWTPFLIAAASLVICFGMFYAMSAEPEIYDLADVSTELAETQDFFTLTISEELKKLNAEKSPETEDIIYDAMRELEVLEASYLKLKKDLKTSGKDQRVIYAMISNFQTRIDILTNVIEHIENIKQLKTIPNDTEITI